MKLSSYECHWALLMTSHHWLGAVRQQANTWANADPDICRHMASLGCNELTPIITQWCTCSTKMAKTDLKPDLKLTKDTPYLTLRIQLLGVWLMYCDVLRGPHHITYMYHSNGHQPNVEDIWSLGNLSPTKEIPIWQQPTRQHFYTKMIPSPLWPQWPTFSPVRMQHAATDPFTETLWAHNPNLVKNYFAISWKIILRSCHNFAHVTTGQLSWHVQICDLIESLKS